MTNFINPKPYIGKNSSLPVGKSLDKTEAIKEAIEIIRENKRVLKTANISTNENPHR